MLLTYKYLDISSPLPWNPLSFVFQIRRKNITLKTRCRKFCERLITVSYFRERTRRLCCKAMLWSWSFWKQNKRGFGNIWLWKAPFLHYEKWRHYLNCFQYLQVWMVIPCSSNVPGYFHVDGSPLLRAHRLVGCLLLDRLDLLLWILVVRARKRLHATFVPNSFINLEIVECILQIII